MEAQIRTTSGRLSIKVEAPTVRDLYKQIAAVDEVFSAETNCGLCQSTDLRFVCRTVEGHDYYELRCRCGARFAFGQSKNGGGLFPKRKDDSGFLANGGWAKYTGEGKA